MLAACLLLACLPAICFSEYYQQEFSPKNFRMYYYARKMQPGYHERMQYPVKPPFRRPYMVYVPKPYIVEIPKPVPYVKLPVSQQYHFEKQLSHPYKIEKPFYVSQLPSSFNTKVPIDAKVPIENPASVTVEKQVLLPVNLGDEKQTESKKPLAYMSFPEEVTSHLELAMNKEHPPLSGFEKESLLEQLKANGFRLESLRSQFVTQGEHKPSSLETEYPKSWSSESKTVLEPIVVSEEPQKWTSFNGSEWVPRFEIADIKTISNDKYRLLKSEKGNFEISEVKYPIQNSKLSQDVSKYLLPDKNNFVPSPALEPVTTLKQIPFGQSLLNEHPSKQSFEFPSSKNYQFYNIDSENIIKPEALTSTIGKTKVETDLKDGEGPSHQWLISKGYQKDSQNTIQEQSEANLKWIPAQEAYTSQNKPAKKWLSNNEQYTVRTESAEQPSKGHGQYDSQKELSELWSNQGHQAQDQREQGEKWTNGHGQYIIPNESDNIQAQQNDQSEPTMKWVRSGDQYIIQKKPTHQWLKSEDTRYTSQKYSPQFAVQEEQGSRATDDQSQNQKAFSSQKFLLSPQFVPDSKDTLQPENHDQQDKKYFHSSQQLEGSFKPLIPSHSQVSYRYQIPHSETLFDQSNPPRLERKPSHQQEQVQSYSKNLLQLQSSAVQTQGDQPSNEERKVYHLQKNTMLKTDNLQPTSNANYQQYLLNHQYYQQSHDLQPKTQDSHHMQESSVQSYPQYSSTPQRHGDYWQQTSQTVYQQNTEGEHKDGPSSLEDYQNKGQYRQQESGIFGQKRRYRHPSRGETGVPNQIIRSNRISFTNTTEEVTTASAPSTTTSQTRRKHRRKQKRRNQETTISPNEKHHFPKCCGS